MNKQRKAYYSHPIFPIRDNIKALTHAALHITLVSLWPEEQYDKLSTDPLMKVIKRILLNAADPYRAYSKYCQRLLLFAEHAGRHRIPFDGTASFILLPEFKTAFMIYRKIQVIRKVNPLYRHSLKGLPEAILELVETSSVNIGKYWLKWLSIHDGEQERKMLHLFIDRELQKPAP